MSSKERAERVFCMAVAGLCVPFIFWALTVAFIANLPASCCSCDPCTCVECKCEVSK